MRRVAWCRRAAMCGASLKQLSPCALCVRVAPPPLYACGCRGADNTWALKSYLVKKRGMNGREVDKALGLPEDFDYLED